ncbi:MAG: outer membrane beta-barrel protein [Paludibacteraceae bacterium]|nr:outer membrane beta-barrel protein [Paludibacteraceae bacterium]
MKSSKLFTTLFLLLLTFAASAQKVTIRGSVLDRDNQEAVAYADVVAYLADDTTGKTADVGITDEKGAFTLELGSGTYRVEVEYLGYKKSTQKLTVTGETATQNMRTIRLRPDAEMLEGAVVVAKAIAVQTKADTVEYNATAVKVPEGSNVEALLKKLPGAQISSDGKITVNGKEIKKILVNGKEFFSDDPQIALKNLPANIVEKIKSYDKQSDEARLTGMDDNDEEGVLDLKIKKGMMQGWMGTVKGGAGSTITQDIEGDRIRYDASVLLNRFDENQQISLIGQGNNINQQGYSERGGGPKGSGNGINSTAMTGLNYVKDKNKIKYGGNAQYGFSKNDSKKKTLTDYKHKSLRDSVITTEHRKRHNFGLDFQTEWKPTSLTTFQFRPNANYSKTEMDRDKQAWNYSNRSLTGKSKTGTNTQNENLNLGGTLRYVQQFSAKKGRNLSVSTRINYSKSHTTKDDNSLFNTLEGQKQLPRHTLDNGHNESYNATAAFTEPVSSHHLMQLRYTFNYRNAHQSDYTYDSTDSLEAQIDSICSDVRNYYTGHEMELNLQGKFTKLKYKVGFNWAPQRSTSTDAYRMLRGATDNKLGGEWQTNNFAPNLMLRYQFDKKHSLMLRYRGQASAPNIEYLQQYIDISDPLDLQMGNEDLKPTYTNRLNLRYNNYFSEMQSNLSANASFSNTMNEIGNEIRFDSTALGTRKITQKKNIDGFGSWNANAFVTYNTPLPNTPFSLQANTQGSLNNKVGFVYNDDKGQSEENNTFTRGFNQKLVATYSKDAYDISLFSSYGFSRKRDKLKQKSQKSNNPYEDFSIGGSLSVSLPWKLTLGSDFSYTNYKGYDGLNSNERNKHVWNAEISRNIFKNNAGNVCLRWVDILNDTRTTSVNETGVSTVESTELWSLGSYFMVYFTYKFNSFGNSAQQEKKGPGSFDFGPGGPRPREGFGGGPREGFGGPRGEGRPPRGDWNGERRRPDFEADTTAGNGPREGYRRGPRQNRSRDSIKAEHRRGHPRKTDGREQPAMDELKPAAPENKQPVEVKPVTEGVGEKKEQQPTETEQQAVPTNEQ